ncbi:MAG: hypothetical protein CMD88_02545 [Gammaproteobacteria bacterium]|nr:hypothetical protein [Gammaproteobacteria bacterium]|tara:strand:+ start:212 stop:922 length:711 start_codon:yes stop_codon:yes gene_type:complete
MSIKIIIPARLNSSRLPRKIMRRIGNITLLEHIVNRAKKLKYTNLIVATDNNEVKNLVHSLDIECWYSSRKFDNGTHRIGYFTKIKKFNTTDIIINIQADEYNFSLSGVEKLINYLSKKSSHSVATLIYKDSNKKNYNNPNIVKAIVDNKNNALYFTRQKSPFSSSNNFYTHIGIYGYKINALKKYSELERSNYENNEKLEQLRYIWNNIPIHCILLPINKSVSINTIDDLNSLKR